MSDAGKMKDKHATFRSLSGRRKLSMLVLGVFIFICGVIIGAGGFRLHRGGPVPPEIMVADRICWELKVGGKERDRIAGLVIEHIKGVHEKIKPVLEDSMDDLEEILVKELGPEKESQVREMMADFKEKIKNRQFMGPPPPGGPGFGGPGSREHFGGPPPPHPETDPEPQAEQE